MTRLLCLAFFTGLFIFQSVGAQQQQQKTPLRPQVFTVDAWAVQEQTKEQTAELEEARTLNQKVVQLFREGKIDEALPPAKRVLQMREKALGKEHPLVMEAAINLAELYI